MRHLLLVVGFFTLCLAVNGQEGYQYDRPEKPLLPGATASRGGFQQSSGPGYSSSPSGSPSYSSYTPSGTTPSYSTVGSSAYPGASGSFQGGYTGSGSTPSYPGSSPSYLTPSTGGSYSSGKAQGSYDSRGDSQSGYPSAPSSLGKTSGPFAPNAQGFQPQSTFDSQSGQGEYSQGRPVSSPTGASSRGGFISGNLPESQQGYDQSGQRDGGFSSVGSPRYTSDSQRGYTSSSQGGFTSDGQRGSTGGYSQSSQAGSQQGFTSSSRAPQGSFSSVGQTGPQGGFNIANQRGSQGSISQAGEGSRDTQGEYDNRGGFGQRGISGGRAPGSQYPGQTAQGNYPQGGFGQPGSIEARGGHDGDDGQYDGGDYSAIPGEPEIDYPIYSEIPQTSFSCDAQEYPGYYADVEARCQVFHICANNKTYDFLCPNGTIFSQEYFVCVWWNQFDCNSAPSFYRLNANIYDYSITGAQAQTGAYSGFQVSDGRSQGSLPGYTGQTGAQSPSVGFLGQSSPQVPSARYPGPQGSSTGYSGESGLQGSSASYPGQSGPQGPSTRYSGQTGAQSPSTGYPGQSGPQGPSSSYQGQSGSQDSLASFPGQSTPRGQSFSPSGQFGQGTTASYPGSQKSVDYPSAQGSFASRENGFVGSSRTTPSSQTPSRTYLSSFDNKSPSTSYSGSQQNQRPSTFTAPSGPSSSFPGSQTSGLSSFPGAQGPTGPSTSYSGSRTPSGQSSSYPGTQGQTTQPTFKGQQREGYPSGAPSGPSFQLPGRADSKRPGALGDSGFPGSPKQPNREYLPPHNY